MEIVQENNYPWDGHLSFTLSSVSAEPITVRLRIPGWVRDVEMPSSLYSFTDKLGGMPVIRINGERTPYKMESGYAVLERKWKKGDKITMDLLMPVREVKADAHLQEDAGKVAIQRGPLMYCLEWKDNGGKVSDIFLPIDVTLQPVVQSSFDGGSVDRAAQLGRITVLKGEALRKDSVSGATKAAAITMIPYYSWANRGAGEMTVWIKQH